MKGNTFRINPDAVGRISSKMMNRFNQNDKVIKKRMELATVMVWRIAHAKRPMMSTMEMKAQGRTQRVSDPNAKAGVPVKTGRLQGSILQKVTKKSTMSYQGEVSTQGVPYAGFMEFGTSRVQARPFMRPAVNLTKDAIKRMMGLKVESNL